MSSASNSSILEHRIRVRGLVRDNLEHIPVLHDLSVGIQAEDVYAGPIPVLVGGPFLMTVQHHVVPFGNHPLERYVLAWVLLRVGNSIQVFDSNVRV